MNFNAEIKHGAHRTSRALEGPAREKFEGSENRQKWTAPLLHKNRRKWTAPLQVAIFANTLHS